MNLLLATKTNRRLEKTNSNASELELEDTCQRRKREKKGRLECAVEGGKLHLELWRRFARKKMQKMRFSI